MQPVFFRLDIEFQGLASDNLRRLRQKFQETVRHLKIRVVFGYGHSLEVVNRRITTVSAAYVVA